jgi:hypothetical protein
MVVQKTADGVDRRELRPLESELRPTIGSVSHLGHIRHCRGSDNSESSEIVLSPTEDDITP